MKTWRETEHSLVNAIKIFSRGIFIIKMYWSIVLDNVGREILLGSCKKFRSLKMSKIMNSFSNIWLSWKHGQSDWDWATIIYKHFVDLKMNA